MLNRLEGQEVRDEAEVGTAELREYMLEEAVHQYKDYYETDPEE